MPTLKLVTWNVNGLRSILGKGLLEFVESQKPDVICLQEVKADPSVAEISALGDYQAIWNCAEKKGYSGTLILTKLSALQVHLGLGVSDHDGEGRVITVDLGPFFLTNVYTPNSQRELTRLGYRLQWDEAFRSFLSGLKRQKPVLFCGDLNVAHKEIDLANPKSNRRNAGFTDEERQSFDQILGIGFVDVFRKFDPSPHHYTWWTYRGDARAKNIGWRLDYWCATPELADKAIRCEILASVMGSDHCPVLLEIGY